MDVLLIVVLAFVGYVAMYQHYGRFIGRRIFALAKDAQTPAVALTSSSWSSPSGSSSRGSSRFYASTGR